MVERVLCEARPSPAIRGPHCAGHGPARERRDFPGTLFPESRKGIRDWRWEEGSLRRSGVGGPPPTPPACGPSTNVAAHSETVYRNIFYTHCTGSL